RDEREAEKERGRKNSGLQLRRMPALFGYAESNATVDPREELRQGFIRLPQEPNKHWRGRISVPRLRYQRRKSKRELFDQRAEYLVRSALGRSVGCGIPVKNQLYGGRQGNTC